MKTAVIVGATGSLRDTVELLASSGWSVTAVGRHQDRVPPRWDEFGVRFARAERDDVDTVSRLVQGADLLVDAMTYQPPQAQQLAAWSKECGGTVQISSNAVYQDLFRGVVSEDRPTTPWDGEALDSQRGYNANKSECDRVLQAEGERVSILRPAKIHGPGCRTPREWAVIKRVLDARPAILLPGDGQTRESCTSTLGLAQAVLACADQPTDRVVNVADRTPLSASEMVRVIVDEVARATGVEHMPKMLPSSPDSPWRLPWFEDKHLDTSRLAELLGHEPLTYEETIGREVAWLIELAQRGEAGYQLPDWINNEYFEGRFDYPAEDAFRAATSTTLRASSAVVGSSGKDGG